MIWGIEARHRWDASDIEGVTRRHAPDLYLPLGDDNGLADRSGNDHDGTAGGGAAVGTGPLLPDGSRSTDLDGADDRITTAYNPFVAGSVRTFAGWAYRDGSGSAMTLVGSTTPTSGDQMILQLVSGSQDVQFIPKNTGTFTTWTAAWPGNTQWVHWALVFDESANTAALYINGVLVSSQTETDNYAATPGNLELGVRGTASSPFDGKMAHFAAWERGLSARAISELFAAGAPRRRPIIVNRRIDDSGAILLPRYKAESITGLQSLGDSEDVRDLAVGREGEIPRRSFRRGKTITYEGLTQAETLAELRQAEADLRAAFDDQRDEKIMWVDPHPGYDDSGAARFFRARSLALEDPDEQGPPRGIVNGYERPFALSVRCSDRRYYDGAEQTESVLVVDADDSETVVCANGGTVATDPILTATSTRTVTSWAPVRAVRAVGPSGDDDLGFAAGVLTASDNDPIVSDGVFIAIGERMLYINEEGPQRSGIYQRIADLTGGFRRFQRTSDADATGEFAQHKQVYVSEGAVYGGRTFEQTTAGAITVNTTPIAFAVLAGIAGLVIANDTVGASLIFPDLQILDGDELVIDFRTRRITVNGVDSPGILDPSSDWWDVGVAGLAAGPNSIRVRSYSGAVGDFDVTLEVSWHDAFA